VIRQAVAFNWDKTAAAKVQTYQATVSAKPASHFLPGQAPVTVPVPVSVPAPTPAPARPQTTGPPLPSPQPLPSSAKTAARRTSSSRRKKAEGKARHFNDQFPTQTGRFKINTEPVHNPAVQQPPPMTRGSGPYSSMYRMVPDSPRTLMSSVSGSVSPAPSLQASSSRSKGQSFGDSQSSAGPSRSASSNHVTSSVHPKTSSSKSSSSKFRSSTKQSTVHQQSVQPNQSSGSKYYRRDYGRDSGTYSPSSNSNTHPSHYRETASPSLSITTQHTNPGDNNTSSSKHPGEEIILIDSNTYLIAPLYRQHMPIHSAWFVSDGWLRFSSKIFVVALLIINWLR